MTEITFEQALTELDQKFNEMWKTHKEIAAVVKALQKMGSAEVGDRIQWVNDRIADQISEATDILDLIETDED